MDRDSELERVLIGGRERRTITIVEYDERWPARFEHECVRVLRALGNTALRVEHIGSTAVPRLAAKPIVDLLVTVADPDADVAFVPALGREGYELRVREPLTACCQRGSAMSMSTFGPIRTLRWIGAWGSATGSGARLPIVRLTNASSASWRDVSGLT